MTGRAVHVEISIHALREEGDDQSLTPTMGVKQFLSTPSARRATLMASSLADRRWRFLSTPSARRATCNHQGEPAQQAISIHALREEGDTMRSSVCTVELISIHALREEGDVGLLRGQRKLLGFLSTPSARRATSLPSTTPALS